MQTLEGLLRLPYETATKTGARVLIVLDEFQAIADIAGADAVLRSQIQHQRDRVSYLFSGSERHLLNAIFADRARPLYGQAEQLRLGPLPPEAAVQLVTDKFSETDRQPGTALSHLVSLAGGHPQRLAFLADALWHQTPPGGVADETNWHAALTARLAGRGAGAAGGRSGAQHSAAQGRAPSRLGRAPTGAAAGRLNLGKGSAAAALAVLVERSVALARDDTGPARLIDPLLAAWVRSRQSAP